MRYVKVTWHHENDDDPVVYFSELGTDGYETRKVQIYRDGRSAWADEAYETDTAGLSEVPFPPLEEISYQEEFEAEEIAAVEFEEEWRRAVLY
ncbi:DUF6881 domain-containing protein [Actinomadura roseirufa]|uniref:DUF6881 domain-containing protein n=1 Tax=Actinomadura roseirufa TaxID=2094049 RepID=UPI0010419772|nr:hypothetical protein [Actinomadura roseirufa]